MKIELRYPDDPEAQKQWETICRGVDAWERNKNRFIRDYESGRIPRTIFNAAKYLCYKN